jgi:hypothetical protein
MLRAMIAYRLCSVISVVLLVACSSGGTSSSSPSGGAPVGGSCATGGACATGLYCKVSGSDPIGVCTTPPAECSSKFTCDGACEAALDTMCGGDGGIGTGARCQILLNTYTVGCLPSPAPRVLGETCSSVVECVAGTYCDLRNPALGKCTALPAACADAATCECLKPISDQCTDGHFCSVVNGRAIVLCP